MKSTFIQFKEFVSSSIWQDLRLAVLLRLSGVRDELEIPGSDTEFLRGRAFELRFLAEYPVELLNQVEKGGQKWQTEQEEDKQEGEEQAQQELELLEQRDKQDR